MSVEANKRVVRRHYDQLFNERRLDLAGELTSPDYLEHGIAPLAERVGDRVDPVEGLKETVRWLTAAFPDLRIGVDELIAEGDKVVSYITMRGTHLGEFQGIPPTGRSFDVKAMHLFRVADGKCVEHWAVRDDLRMLQQLGAIRIAGS